MNEAVMFGELAAFYGGELTEEEKLELWHVCQITSSSSIRDVAMVVIAISLDEAAVRPVELLRV